MFDVDFVFMFWLLARLLFLQHAKNSKIRSFHSDGTFDLFRSQFHGGKSTYINAKETEIPKYQIHIKQRNDEFSCRLLIYSWKSIKTATHIQMHTKNGNRIALSTEHIQQNRKRTTAWLARVGHFFYSYSHNIFFVSCYFRFYLIFIWKFHFCAVICIFFI